MVPWEISIYYPGVVRVGGVDVDVGNRALGGTTQKTGLGDFLGVRRRRWTTRSSNDRYDGGCSSSKN